jgi:hypothetical protein
LAEGKLFTKKKARLSGQKTQIETASMYNQNRSTFQRVFTRARVVDETSDAVPFLAVELFSRSSSKVQDR